SKLRRTLVVIPKEVNVQSWADEIVLHAPDLTYTALLGSTPDRRKLAQAETDLYLVNYAGLQFLMAELQQVPGKKKKKRLVDEALATAFAERFDMVVFDESHKLGNSQSLVYRLCRRFTKHCPRRYALTGTPFGRNPMMLWSQFHVVDDGATLGSTLGVFRSAFFNAKENFFGGIEYEFDQRMRDDLYRMIRHRSIYYADAEYVDLPKLIEQKVRVRFSISADQQYNNILRRIKESRGNIEELKASFH